MQTGGKDLNHGKGAVNKPVRLAALWWQHGPRRGRNFAFVQPRQLVARVARARRGSDSENRVQTRQEEAGTSPARTGNDPKQTVGQLPAPITKGAKPEYLRRYRE